MIKIKFEGMDKLEAKLRGIEKQVKYATIVALNHAAYVGTQAAKAEMRRVFDRPTPWVVNAVMYWKAGKAGTKVRSPGAFTQTGKQLYNRLDSDRLYAVVDLSGDGNKQGVTVDQVLRAQIHGGQRRHKRHEVALQRAGILPAGMGIVPGAAAQIDRYGNMSSGQIVQIMAWFNAFGEVGYKANMTDKTRDRLGRDKRSGQKGYAYFALKKPRGKLLPGIYQRFRFAMGGQVLSSVKPVMIFVRLPSYRARFDFYGVVEQAARAEFHRQFPAVLDEAMRTAK